jgi:formylglycine-generating enzyme required for sulfatase activity/serine/threonine protein kinase
MASDASANGLDAEPQVFISYARQDAERVLAIVRTLEEQGATVWRDADRILGGQYYGEQIVHAIAHSKVVMLMCSPQAFQSDNVHREVLLTWDHYHRRYLPVWLCPPTDIPERFRYCLTGCQWIDAHSQPSEQWVPQLLKAFRALGVETRNPAGATPRPADSPAASPPRTLRFRPGDRPIRGADWELERLLGKGGFGEVWKAHNPQLPGLPPVALKFCLALDDQSRDLLRHEANMVLQAQREIRSEGIVPLLHAYLNNDPPCLEFPYIAGGTLVGLLEECRASAAGSFSPMQAQGIVGRIAKIVGPAHRATPRLVHRDLKPANVMVEKKGGKIVLRVTDFGIGAVAAQPVLARSRSASSLRDNLSSVLTGSYSPLYASPQQMRGDKADPRDDVYALGVIWYQLLQGDLSSPAPTGRRWVEVLRARGMKDVAIELLSSCFESDPAYRPADAGMLAEQLRVLTTSTPELPADAPIELPGVESRSLPPTPSAPPPEPTRQPAPRAARAPGPSSGGVTPDSKRAAPGPTAQPGHSNGASSRPEPVLVPPIPASPASQRPETDEAPESPAPQTEAVHPSRKSAGLHALVKSVKKAIRRALVTTGLLGLLGMILYVVIRFGTSEFITTGVGQIKLKRIPAGEFEMGSPFGEGPANELPQHRVRLTRPFYLGICEVTQAQYQAVMGDNRSHFSPIGAGRSKVAGHSTDQLPMENVTWIDAVNFCNLLSEKEGRKRFYEIDGRSVHVPDWNGSGYRLPTEAEWEYACRARTATKFSFGDDEKKFVEYGWSRVNAGGRTHPVGEMLPNGFGLFDMHGNVREWCWDGDDRQSYPESPEDDPRGVTAHAGRVYRGGAWESAVPEARSAVRGWASPWSRGNALGFRLARW